METQTLFAVYTTVDQWGTQGECVCFCKTEDGAKEAARRVGWYGGRGIVEQVEGIVLPDGRVLVEAKGATLRG